jgi:hypothetical protein
MPGFPAATKKGGMAQATPDVCMVPAPPPPAGPGGIPTPFVNMASLSSTDKTISKVVMENKETIVEDSEVPSTKGDEAGCAQAPPSPVPKGVVSQKNMSKAVFKKYSSKVKAKGKAIVTHTAITSHNGSGNANMPAGVHSTPSQSKVIVGL